MPEVFKAKYSRDLYFKELQTVIRYGMYTETRGRKTLELLNVISEVTEPWHHCILIPSRRWNPWLALSEALWILAGRNDIEALKPYNSHIGDYSDDGSTLYGAYGKRIYNQIDPLVERLKKDPSDRRAVLQIWDSHIHPETFVEGRYDLTVETKDPPCNNMVYFKLRQNRLHMTVINRSNDIHFGLFAVNLPTFGILQSYIAARLGVEIGTQTHLSNSLHVYTDDKRATDITERMMLAEEDLPAYPEHELAFRSEQFSTYVDHNHFAQDCSDVLDGEVGTYPFLQFASGFLEQYRNKDFSYYIKGEENYQDWVLAGRLFMGKAWK